MALIKMPEGVELDIKAYLVGMVNGVEAEVMFTVKGLPAFGDSVNEQFDLPRLIEIYNLDEMGTNWRVMTRAEIKDYREREEIEEALSS